MSNRASSAKAASSPETLEDLNDPARVEAFRRALLVKREELLNLYKHDVRVGQESTDDNADDFADRANNSYNRELMFALSNGEREIMLRIDEAVERIDRGTFGHCVHCERPIGLPRLEAVPWARYCIRCQEQDELGILDE